MGVKVGIPSTLFYYTYYPMWRTFFDEIGIQTVTSGNTTKTILDKGVREALADACVPVKLFFGHVIDIKDKVDYLYIPRVVCLNRKTVYCPKFLGLPDMIRHSLENVPPIIDVRVDTRQSRCALLQACLETGKSFGTKKATVYKAYWKARKILRRYTVLLRKGFGPHEAISHLNNPGKVKIKQPYSLNLKFALLGYPYIIYDSFISVNIISKLKRLGVNALTVENIHPLCLSLQRNCDLPKRLFWTFSDMVLKAAHLFFNQGNIDGIIHVTAFGCGPDSLTNKFIELEAKKHQNIPFMTLMLDEHSGEAGIATRLEAFVDMVKRRKEIQICRK
ncbi:MAG: hypothetical protein XD97_0750 [Pelotomaculum thermopropionicum]|uniref:DUF2229 domain-containing protein n=1 Tax=Pelotomaculum thermopropionicum TaxID=110500 RepID=A0A101HQ73_9FIRM|nr:MAG: hypothetical protein XD97_0750 [Pelotomaculum thermopropionicum]